MKKVVKAALAVLLIVGAGCAASVAMAGMQRVSEMRGGEACSGAIAARRAWDDRLHGVVGGAKWGG